VLGEGVEGLVLNQGGRSRRTGMSDEGEEKGRPLVAMEASAPRLSCHVIIDLCIKHYLLCAPRSNFMHKADRLAHQHQEEQQSWTKSVNNTYQSSL
jgi:hypothetical protein